MMKIIPRALALILIIALILPLCVSAADSNWRNVLLIGVDSYEEDAQDRSDTMIIASINAKTGAIKLTSLMRDTLVTIPGRKKQDKLNAAYMYGGASLLLKTIKQNYGVDVKDYISIDIINFQYVIERLGGIDIPVTKKEIVALNNCMAYLIYMEKQVGRYDGELDDELLPLDAYGDNVHLTGRQAVAYARIRKIDTDFVRTSRQRIVLDAILQKARAVTNPFTFVAIAMELVWRVKTNLNIFDALMLGKTVLFGESGSFQELRLPADGEYTEELTHFYIIPNWKKTKARLNKFLGIAATKETNPAESDVTDEELLEYAESGAQ